MILITSAAYVVPSIRNEIGSLPPCLLPIGNKRLVEFQAHYLRKIFNDKISISLPESYEVTNNDLSIFKNLNLNFIKVPDSLNLSESITYSLNIIDDDDDIIRILHGDTLLFNFPQEDDIIAMGKPQGDYDWEFDNFKNSDDIINGNIVWAGYFSFSSKRKLIKSLTINNSSFVNGVREYKKNNIMKTRLCPDWLDFGHATPYFLSRSKITTERSFNKLNIKRGVITKSGDDEIKIKAEYNWYKEIPSKCKIYIPQLIDYGEDDLGHAYYSLEYLSLIALNEIFVFGKNPPLYWQNKFNLIKFFLSTLFLDSCDILLKDQIHKESHSLFKDKTIERLDKYLLSSKYTYDTLVLEKVDKKITLETLRDECINIAINSDIKPSILHGDLCLSNILYDSRSDMIKVIDPRGLTSDREYSIYGNQNYDLAKLAHSFIGFYDLIIAGHYKIITPKDGIKKIVFEIDQRIELIREAFILEFFEDDNFFQEIISMVILLFLSMLPLHADRPDRQEAMLLNAIRLYDEYI